MYSVSDCYLECKAIVFMYVVSVREKLLHTISLNATMNNVREKERRRSVYKKMYRKYTEERETKKKRKKKRTKGIHRFSVLRLIHIVICSPPSIPGMDRNA